VAGYVQGGFTMQVSVLEFRPPRNPTLSAICPNGDDDTSAAFSALVVREGTAMPAKYQGLFALDPLHNGIIGVDRHVQVRRSNHGSRQGGLEETWRSAHLLRQCAGWFDSGLRHVRILYCARAALPEPIDPGTGRYRCAAPTRSSSNINLEETSAELVALLSHPNNGTGKWRRSFASAKTDRSWPLKHEVAKAPGWAEWRRFGLAADGSFDDAAAQAA
jgi:hypothetical protein